MATSIRDLENTPFPPSVTNPTWETLTLSRPKRLTDRVATYAALLANNGLDESEDAVHALAFFDEMISPPVGKPVEFFRTAGLLNSRDVARAIIDLRNRNILKGGQGATDWVTFLTISKDAFDDAYRRRWTPWGFYLWTFVDGLMGNGGHNRGDEPRVHVNNSARDLTWVAEELPGYAEWLDGVQPPRDYAKPQQVIEQIRGIDPHVALAGHPRAVWILGRYLCTKTDKRLPESADFGGRRFLRVVRELTVVEGGAPEGDAELCAFFKGDEFVGELTFGKKFRMVPAFAGKQNLGNTTIDDHLLLSFSVEDAFRGQGIGQVMLRHAMTRGVRWVGKELAGCLEPLMVRHGRRMPDGVVSLEAVHWGRVRSVNS